VDLKMQTNQQCAQMHRINDILFLETVSPKVRNGWGLLFAQRSTFYTQPSLQFIIRLVNIWLISWMTAQKQFKQNRLMNMCLMQ